MLTDNYYLAFVFGMLSSLFNINAGGMAIQSDSSDKMSRRVNLPMKWLMLPFMYGILAVIIFWSINTYLPKEWRNYWLAGLLTGFFYASFGSMANYSRDVYGYEPWQVYAIDLVFYTLLYGVVFRLMDDYLC